MTWEKRNLSDFYACLRKRKYRTQSLADKQAHKINAKGSDGYLLNSYHCTFCLSWHIGHSRKYGQLVPIKDVSEDGKIN